MVRLVGIKRAQGEYEGRKYDNYNLMIVDDSPIGSGWVPGSSSVYQEKVNASLFEKAVMIFGDFVIGEEITVLHDRYGRVSEVLKLNK